MTTITLKINERSKAGKTLKSLIDMLQSQPGVEVVEPTEQSSPYNPEFVTKIRRAEASKERYIFKNVDELWESLK